MNRCTTCAGRPPKAEDRSEPSTPQGMRDTTHQTKTLTSKKRKALMKSIEKELKGILRQTERYNGFDGYDSADGDMDFDDSENFDGDEMSYFDGDQMSYASGNQAAPLSDPYVIQYANTTTNDVTAIVFGYNDNFNGTNFGNPAAVVITNLQGGTYGRLFAQSQGKEFKIGKIRFQSSTAAQLQQTVTIYHVDANGKQYSSPLNLSVMLDAYQFQSTVLDVTKVITVDGNTYLSFTLKASATLVLSIYPVAVVSAKAVLNGGKSVNTAKAPRLSGKNSAPVIIQTGSGVRSISQKG